MYDDNSEAFRIVLDKLLEAQTEIGTLRQQISTKESEIFKLNAAARAERIDDTAVSQTSAMSEKIATLRRLGTELWEAACTQPTVPTDRLAKAIKESQPEFDGIPF